jgi:hypothetical protein
MHLEGRCELRIDGGVYLNILAPYDKARLMRNEPTDHVNIVSIASRSGDDTTAAILANPNRPEEPLRRSYSAFGVAGDHRKRGCPPRAARGNEPQLR